MKHEKLAIIFFQQLESFERYRFFFFISSITRRNESNVFRFLHAPLCTQLTTDSLSLSLDSGQVRLQLISYDTGRDIVTRVGDDLHLQDWVKVSVQFAERQYKLDGMLIDVSGFRNSSLRWFHTVLVQRCIESVQNNATNKY